MYTYKYANWKEFFLVQKVMGGAGYTGEKGK